MLIKHEDNGLPTFPKQGDLTMRNKIIEDTIDKVVDESSYPEEFKSAFKQFVKNKYDNNAKLSDLKSILTLLPDETEDENI